MYTQERLTEPYPTVTTPLAVYRGPSTLPAEHSHHLWVRVNIQAQRFDSVRAIGQAVCTGVISLKQEPQPDVTSIHPRAVFIARKICHVGPRYYVSFTPLIRTATKQCMVT